MANCPMAKCQTAKNPRANNYTVKTQNGMITIRHYHLINYNIIVIISILDTVSNFVVSQSKANMIRERQTNIIFYYYNLSYNQEKY